MSQSLAIIDYLDETWASQPLMPSTARERQRVRTIAQMIACDIHPLGNLRVQRYLESTFAATETQREDWTRHWMRQGFNALEQVLADSPSTGSFCEGDVPSMADCCLVPQVYNARRFGIDVSQYRTIERINEACLALPAVDAARPERQADAPPAA